MGVQQSSHRIQFVLVRLVYVAILTWDSSLSKPGGLFGAMIFLQKGLCLAHSIGLLT